MDAQVACPLCAADGPLFDGNCPGCRIRDVARSPKSRVRQYLARVPREDVVAAAAVALKVHVQRFLRAVAEAEEVDVAEQLKEEVVAARRAALGAVTS